MPIAVAHGEGRAEFAASGLEALEASGLIGLRFVDSTGAVTSRYPTNPNGSPNGIACVTSRDGRATIVMPHPERVFRTIQHSWAPATWGEDGPLLRIFRNARVFAG